MTIFERVIRFAIIVVCICPLLGVALSISVFISSTPIALSVIVISVIVGYEIGTTLATEFIADMRR